jgi:hypothetical protein
MSRQFVELGTGEIGLFSHIESGCIPSVLEPGMKVPLFKVRINLSPVRATAP